MRLDERKEDILDFVVRDYIKAAEPVSSGRIAGKRASWGSPATLRNTMLELDEAGYLYQPHTSAGRAPTEKGYRYFVDNLLKLKEPDDETRARMNRIFEKAEKLMDEAFEELSGEMASRLKLFSGVGFWKTGEFVGRGLAQVLREPEFAEQNSAAEFADFAEKIGKEIGVKEILSSEPVFSIKSFGSVSVSANGKSRGRVVVFSAGPRRMDYEKAASMLRFVSEKII